MGRWWCGAAPCCRSSDVEANVQALPRGRGHRGALLPGHDGSDPVLTAQTPAARRNIVEWDDSLQLVSSASALADFVADEKAGPDDARDLRIALYDFRRGAVDDSRGDIERAFIRLDAVAAGHRSWPWPDYAMAREFFELSQEDAPVVASAGLHLGESHVEAAWRRCAKHSSSNRASSRRAAWRSGSWYPRAIASFVPTDAPGWRCCCGGRSRNRTRCWCGGAPSQPRAQ